MDDLDDAIWRALNGYNVDPTKVRYPGTRKIVGTLGWQPETTPGTPIVRKVTAAERREIEAEEIVKPEPLGWHYITIPEEDE